jgi:hypothetical protein
MSLFDMFKDKATELLQGAKDQVSELTGVELPVDGVIDQVGQTAGNVTDTGQNLADNASGAITEAEQSATGAVTDATDRLTGK